MDFAVIEPIAGPVGFGVDNEGDLAALEVEKMKAARERNDRAAAVLAQGHRADPLRHVPTADFTPRGRGAEHATVEDVDPIQALLLGVPDRSFAQRGLDVDNDFNAHHRPRQILRRDRKKADGNDKRSLFAGRVERNETHHSSMRCR
jgi:hypothetical protein